MRYGFVTCVQLGLSCMEAIYANDLQLSLAITLNDDSARLKSGRVYLDDFCTKHAVPLYKAATINDPRIIDAIREANLDYLFIIGWSQIANDDVISAPKYGAIGMHPTLLPEGRGRAAIPWAILKQLEKTGVTAFRLSAQVDKGAVLGQVEIPLRSNIDATELYSEVCDAHVILMNRLLPRLEENNLLELAQSEEGASHWPGRTPADGQIQLDGSVHDAERLIRATTRPYPGAFVNLDKKKYTIWRAKIAPSAVAAPDCFSIAFRDGTLLLEEYDVVEID